SPIDAVSRLSVRAAAVSPSFPSGGSFPPRPPQRACPLCSAASSVLFPRPTSHPRTCSSFGCCLHEPVRRAFPDTDEISQFPCKELLHAHKVSDCARFFPCKPIRHGSMLPARQRTRSAPRNWTRFAAQYLARGLPCERFTSPLTGHRASLGVGAVG